MRSSLLLALSLAACAAAGDPRGTGPAPGPLAVFPSDRFTIADARTRTGLRVALPSDVADDAVFERFPDLVREVESLDGFGTSAPMWVRFDGPIDPAGLPTRAESLDADAAVRVFAVETGAPVEIETDYDGPSHTLFVTPFGALAPKTRYALVVSKRLSDLEGRPLRSDAAWIEPGLAGDAAVAVQFTTQSVTDTLAALALREVEHGDGEFPAPLSACADQPEIGWVGKGRLRSPDYRTVDNRFPVQLDDAKADPAPADAEIPYLIVLPKGAKGAPTVLVQHGLSGDKEGVLLCNIGHRYAARGYATVAIDAAWHGERGPGGKKPSGLSYLRVLFGVWTDGETITAKLRYGRDAFRQTALDHVQLAALVKALAPALDETGPAGAPDGAPDLSGEIFYNGESMGGIIGSLTTAVAPNLPASVLNVPGGRLSNLVLLSEIHLYELVAQPIVGAVAELAPADVRRFFALFQLVAERGDPINYAPLWWKQPAPGRPKKSVVIQETTDDVLVPNRTTEDLARAGGLKQLLPALVRAPDLEAETIPAGGLADNLAPGLAGGMVQLKTVTRGGETEQAPHGTMGTPEALNEAADFFDGYRAGAPVVTRVY